MRDLIEQQGVTMASTALGVVRSRTATADRKVERFVRRALGMQPLEEPGTPVPSPVAPAPPVARPQVAAVPIEEPAAKPTPVAGHVQWAMHGPTEDC